MFQSASRVKVPVCVVSRITPPQNSGSSQFVEISHTYKGPKSYILQPNAAAPLEVDDLLVGGHLSRSLACWLRLCGVRVEDVVSSGENLWREHFGARAGVAAASAA